MSEICPICHRQFKRLSASHASVHNMTLPELRAVEAPEQPEEVPTLALEEIDDRLSELLTDTESMFLSEQQKQYLLYRLAGVKKGRIAKLIGVERTVFYTGEWRTIIPVIDKIVTRILADDVLAARAITLATAREAAIVNKELLRSKDERIRQGSAHDILDRSGISRRPGASVVKQTIEVEFSAMTTEELDKFIAEELEKEQAIEGEFKEIEGETE